MSDDADETPGKVPALSLVFWIIKIAATTLGETAGDAASMSMQLGYLAASAIFALLFIAAAAAQIAVRRLYPILFWTVIVATTTLGTTLADLLDRSLGIGYAGGAGLLAAMLGATLVSWHACLGSVSLDRLASRKGEVFYWMTVLFSQTLGTALGDWFADPDTGLGLGYQGSALVFGAALACVGAAWLGGRAARGALFWAAFILSRPLGATLGDFLDKPLANGGLALNRYAASAWLAAFIVACLIALPHRAEALRQAP